MNSLSLKPNLVKRGLCLPLFFVCLACSFLYGQPTPFLQDMAIVLEDSAAVYAVQAPSGAPIKRLQKGSSIKITGISKEPGPDWRPGGWAISPKRGFHWYQTDIGRGRTGWIYGRYLGLHPESPHNQTGIDFSDPNPHFKDLDGDGKKDLYTAVIRINSKSEAFRQHIVWTASGQVYVPDDYNLSLEAYGPWFPSEPEFQDVTGDGISELIFWVMHGMEGGSEQNLEIYGLYAGKLKLLIFVEDYLAYSYSDRHGIDQCSSFQFEKGKISRLLTEFEPHPDSSEYNPHHVLQKSHIIYTWEPDSLAFLKRQSTSPDLPVIAEVVKGPGKVYSNHSTRSTVLGTIVAGDNALVLGAWTKIDDGYTEEQNPTPVDHWVHVRLAGEIEGWIDSATLKFDEECLNRFLGADGE